MQILLGVLLLPFALVLLWVGGSLAWEALTKDGLGWFLLTLAVVFLLVCLAADAKTRWQKRRTARR